MNTITYPSTCSATALAEWGSGLPGQIRQAAIQLMEADSSSQYYYRLYTEGHQIRLLLIEANAGEHYAVCHCFSADRWDPGYGYESLPLSSIQTFSEMAEELNLTS